MFVLVINSGSSSIKFHVFELETETLCSTCTVERIGQTNSFFNCHNFLPGNTQKDYLDNLSIIDHKAGLEFIFNYLKSNNLDKWLIALHAIGHRVVHGGATFDKSRIIDDNVIIEIEKLVPLAPLHNSANLTCIKFMHQLCPNTLQVAAFDTAFFQALPAHANRYAIPEDLYTKHHVRRYGFHGTSHNFITKQTAQYLQRPLTELKLISLHLGNGASVAAIHNGICIDTSMGFTPLEGLMMGTRSGDIDPSIPFYLAKTLKMNLDEIETLLNKESGFKGLCGVSDMREVHKLAESGNNQAQLAIDMYCYRICKYIGAYYIALGGLDALTFTAGVGENDSEIRQLICNNLSVIGITIDKQRNNNDICVSYHINKENSKISVLVIPADEELEIFRQVLSVTRETGV